MSATKYFLLYVGVATCFFGFGLAYKHSNVDSNLYTSLEKSFIGTAEKERFNYDEIDLSRKHNFSSAIKESRDILLRHIEISGTPGVSIAVNVDGKTVWTEGFGLADVENEIPCIPDTVMRIASISKSVTMTVLARLWQEGLVDLDKPVQEYVPKWPVHLFEGEEVNITTRMIVSHLSGIRDFIKKGQQDILWDEIHNTKTYKTTEEALDFFKDDELLHKPGTTYSYSSYAWTLVMAVMEAATNKTFPKIMSEFFNQMGLKRTSLDYNESIIKHRSRFYSRVNGQLENAHLFDASLFWAGGGYLSTVGDLTRFGDMMLFCFQQRGAPSPPGYLSAATAREMWSIKASIPGTALGTGYGMGWGVVPQSDKFAWGVKQSMVAFHSGGAVGGASYLMIAPRSGESTSPAGVTIAIVGNLEYVNWGPTAHDIANKFEEAIRSR